MAGYNLVLKIRRLEQALDQLDLCIMHPRHQGYRDEEVAAVVPKDHAALPLYSRDAEIFIGTLNQIEDWILGVNWAREYDRMLKVSDTDKRKRREQSVRNRKLMSQIKDPATTEQI